MALNLKIDVFLKQKSCCLYANTISSLRCGEALQKITWLIIITWLIFCRKFVPCLLHVVIGSLTETLFSSLTSMFLSLRSNKRRELSAVI